MLSSYLHIIDILMLCNCYDIVPLQHKHPNNDWDIRGKVIRSQKRQGPLDKFLTQASCGGWGREFPMENFCCVRRKFHSGGKFKIDSKPIWYQTVTVKFYFSLLVTFSVTSCQCLQQTDACLWSPLCDKISIFRTYDELWTDAVKAKKQLLWTFFTQD